MATSRVEDIMDKIRASGGRVTQSRRMVVERIVGSHHHVTAPDLIETMREADPEFHESTVYRVLERLTDLHIVEPVRVQSGPTVYHLTDADHVHHHLLCAGCGDVVEASSSLLDDVAAQVAVRHGFTLQVDAPTTLLGLCQNCQADPS